MQELINSIAENGILIVIAGIFLWDKIYNAKTVNKLLMEISEATKANQSNMSGVLAAIDNTRIAIDNSTTALGMVEMTQKHMSGTLDRHDKRSEYMNTDIIKILEHVKK